MKAVAAALCIFSLVFLVAAVAVGLNFLGLIDRSDDQRRMFAMLLLVVFIALVITGSKILTSTPPTVGRRR